MICINCLMYFNLSEKSCIDTYKLDAFFKFNSVTVNNFQLCQHGTSWVEPVHVFCSRTQHSDAVEARTPDPLVLSLALNH